MPKGLEVLEVLIDRTARFEHAHTSTCITSQTPGPVCGAGSRWEVSPSLRPMARIAFNQRRLYQHRPAWLEESITGIIRNICPYMASCAPSACVPVDHGEREKRHPHPRMTSSQASPALQPSIPTVETWSNGPWTLENSACGYSPRLGRMVGCASTRGLHLAGWALCWASLTESPRRRWPSDSRARARPESPAEVASKSTIAPDSCSLGSLRGLLAHHFAAARYTNTPTP